MQIEKIEPRTITYRLSPDKGDKEYLCMWARYTFDCDNGQLDISSDAGDYTYRWGIMCMKSLCILCAGLIKNIF